MPKPHFSELLQTRRHELGLSIEQASRILKLREDVLVSFEEGDFERIPQSGYAQGMLSSYARYLGLNSREIIDLFQEELYHYVNGTSSHELRRRTRDTQAGRFISGYDVVNAEGSRPKAYVEYKGLLPTSGGPAGDMGAFASVSDARPRRTMPMAGSGPSAASAYGRGSYGQDQQTRSYNAAPQGYSRQQDDEYARGSARRARNQRRRTTNNNDPASRLLSQRQQVTGAASSQMTRQYSGGRANGGRGGSTRPQRTYRRDDVSTRRVVSGDYSDDMRYDDHARPYERASTITGRRSSRNIASVDRPNVRRRAPQSGYGSGNRGGQRGRRRGSQRGGILGFFSDSRNATFAIIVILAMVLTGILVFAATSCVNAKTGASSSQAGQTVSVNSADSGSSKGDDSSSSSSSNSNSSSKSTTSTSTSDNSSSATADATGDDATATDSAATTTQQATVVKVSVADGEYSWLEITCDGTSAVAESVTGPWEQEFTVTDSITIRAANPSKVSVTENGKKVDFTSKASGTGTLTIKGTPVTSTDQATDATAADATGATTTTTTGTTTATQ